jgi:hypothetical protein
MKALILTPWTGTGTPITNPYRPLISSIYSMRCQDATNQPAKELQPDPNLLAVEAVLSPEALASIETDPRFYVLWSE